MTPPLLSTLSGVVAMVAAFAAWVVPADLPATPGLLVAAGVGGCVAVMAGTQKVDEEEGAS